MTNINYKAVKQIVCHMIDSTAQNYDLERVTDDFIYYRIAGNALDCVHEFGRNGGYWSDKDSDSFVTWFAYRSQKQVVSYFRRYIKHYLAWFNGGI